VRRTLTSCSRPFAGILALVVGLTFVAPPAAMADAPRTAAATPSRLASATALKLARLNPPARAFAQSSADPAAAPDSGHSFFSTPTGVAAIVLMVAGAGFVAFSIHRDNSKVHSPIR